jgi:pyruvate dehydrogenase E1 component alpha subunit
MNLRDLESAKQQLIDFERDIALLCKSGKINGPAHLTHGNEEQLVKIFRGLKIGDYICDKSSEYSREHLQNEKLVEVPDNPNPAIFRGVQENDWVCASYRSHYHALLKGISPEWLREQIISGKSMEIYSKEHKFLTSGIVPGQIPIALGIAQGLKINGSENGRVWAFCGDMAAESGIFYECVKYADNHDLPITFVVEDNGLSVDTPTEVVWGGLESNLRRNTMRYVYSSGIPHQGVGKEVGF